MADIPSHIYELWNHCLEYRRPVAFYQLPHILQKKAMVQWPHEIEDMDEVPLHTPCFWMEPSKHSKLKIKKICIQGRHIDLEKPYESFALIHLIIQQNVRLETPTPTIHPFQAPDKGTFVQSVAAAIDYIKSGRLDKVVLSRSEKRPLPSADMHPVTIWYYLTEYYPSVFNYLMYHPESGIWLGATPELLAGWNQHTFETVSLAATRKPTLALEEIIWNDKERQEQAWVSDHIQQILKQYSGEAPTIEGPVTIDTGYLKHLKTVFRLPLNTEHPIDLQQMIRALHPTPAVNGSPNQEALHYIQNHEAHDRLYYTGLVGFMDPSAHSKLFVNLRCLKWEDHQIQLFAGCGITSASHPETEWEETEWKINTLMSIAQKAIQSNSSSHA